MEANPVIDIAASDTLLGIQQLASVIDNLWIYEEYITPDSQKQLLTLTVIFRYFMNYYNQLIDKLKNLQLDYK
jgi:hypothetical protein